MIPDTETAPSTAELNRILQASAHEMLESFLTNYREKHRSNSLLRPPSSRFNVVSLSVHRGVHSGFEFMKYCWVRSLIRCMRNFWPVGRRPRGCTRSSKNPAISYLKKWRLISWLRRNTTPCANCMSVPVPWRSSWISGPSMLFNL